MKIILYNDERGRFALLDGISVVSLVHEDVNTARLNIRELDFDEFSVSCSGALGVTSLGASAVKLTPFTRESEEE